MVRSHTVMVWSHLEPKTECLPECHLECHLEYHPKSHSECHPESRDQLNMVRSHTAMVWSHLKPKKNLLVGGGGRPNLLLAPGSGHRVTVTEWEPDLSLSLTTEFRSSRKLWVLANIEWSSWAAWILCVKLKWLKGWSKNNPISYFWSNCEPRSDWIFTGDALNWCWCCGKLLSSLCGRGWTALDVRLLLRHLWQVGFYQHCSSQRPMAGLCSL